VTIAHPKECIVDCFDKNLHYYYFDLSEIEGKLLKILCKTTNPNYLRAFNYEYFLIFKNKAERHNFEGFVKVNYNKLDEAQLRTEYKSSIEYNFYGYANGFDPSEVILEVVKAYKLYHAWKGIENLL
jgi:hypothetical protein